MALTKTVTKIVVVLVLLVGLAAYASVDSKMDILQSELKQRQQAQRARALLQNLRMTVVDTNSGIQEIVDGGSFNTLDSEIKTALLTAWQISKDAEVAFESNADVKALLDWRP